MREHKTRMHRELHYWVLPQYLLHRFDIWRSSFLDWLETFRRRGCELASLVGVPLGGSAEI